MIYLIFAAGIAWCMWSTYGHHLTDRFKRPVEKADIIQNFPMIVDMLKHLPEKDVYTALVRGHVSAFLERFQNSFLGNESKRFETTIMQRSREKIEKYVREIIFRLPNDLDKQTALETDLTKLLRVLQLMIDDVKERWRNNYV